jgi:TadE-like protein
MWLPYRKRDRRGATMVEAALILTAFLILVLGMLDIGIAVVREQILSQAARQGARAAIVHGSRSFSPWGPSQYGPASASSADAKAQVIANYLAGIDPSTVNVTYQWLDGSNLVEARVQVTLTAAWTPIVQSFFGNNSVTLSASSTMPIAH